MSKFTLGAFPTLKKLTTVVRFPTPPLATWNDLRIQFVDGQTLIATIGDVQKTLTCVQMGLLDHRQRKPNKQWHFLQLLGLENGSYVCKMTDQSKCQKRREELSKTLSKVFQIDGDPFLVQRNPWTISALFKIVSEQVPSDKNEFSI